MLAVLGFVNWLVTRWRIDGDDLRIETGLIRRQSLRFPLAQVQAIDIVQPGLARIFRVAELRLRHGRRERRHRTARVPAASRRSSRFARGCSASQPTARRRAHEPEEIEERVLTTVPTLQLVASIFVSDVGIVVELVFAALVVTAFLAPAAATGIVGGGAAELIAVATLVWRRFNQEYKLTVAAAPDGLRLRSGPRGAERRDDPAGPRAGGAPRRALPLAAARLVPARGRPRRPAEAEGGGGGDPRAAARAPARRAAARSRSSCSSSSFPARRAPSAGRRGASPGRARCATASSRGAGRTRRS